MKTDFSVIVPVYNVEYYIEACIQSIVDQTWPNWELILVDDGSTDGSGAVCDRWAGHDKRIHVIHQQNKGVSAARNAGMAIACGEYMAFVDGDDTVKSDWLKGVQAANDKHRADIVSFGMERLRNGQVIITRCIPAFFAENRAELEPYFSDYFEYIFGSVCFKVYKTELLRRIHAAFDENLRINEDAFFDYDCITEAQTFLNLDRSYYQYHFWRNSSSNRGITNLLSVFEYRVNRHEKFIEEMGFKADIIPTAQELLLKGVFIQYLQASVTSTSFRYRTRCKILNELYQNDLYREEIKKRLTQEPVSIGVVLGRISVKLRWPVVVAAPARFVSLFKSYIMRKQV